MKSCEALSTAVSQLYYTAVLSSDENEADFPNGFLGGQKIMSAMLMAVAFVACMLAAPAAAPAADAAAAPKRALVLSGGGAKGAFEVGVLQRFCEDDQLRGSWSMLTGAAAICSCSNV